LLLNDELHQLVGAGQTDEQGHQGSGGKCHQHEGQGEFPIKGLEHLD
jgi:hypothetical protein